jgi:hypothetical protein
MYELVEVKRFGIPSPGVREQVESTHLKSPGWRRQYVSGFYEDSDFEVTLNTRLLSYTDELLATLAEDGDVRGFKAVIPENGVAAAQVTGTARCIGYVRGDVVADEVIESTATFRVVTIAAVAAYSA